MLTGAIAGAIGAIIGLILVFAFRNQKYKKLMASIKEPGVEYSGLFYYASSSRYQKSFKVYDSYGILYIIGRIVYYKTSSSATPWAFKLSECRVQQEADWRKLKWFSITAPNGEKYYFDSFKMGAVSNNSSETLRALAIIQSKTGIGSTTSVPHPPPPPTN